MKKILTIMALLVAFVTTGFADDTWTVAGSSEALFGNTWDPTNTDNDMSLYEGTSVYILKKAGVALDAGTIQFKVCQNHAWTTAYPSDNFNLVISEGGTYDVTIIFNSESQSVTASLNTDAWTVVGASEALFGSAWDATDTDGDNTMTTTDGITYALTKSNLTLEAGSYEYKVVKNHNWEEENYGSGDGNKSFTINQAGNYNITFTYNNYTKELSEIIIFNLPGTVIWSSETPVAANWGSNISVAKEQFANAKVGDKVHVAVEGVTPASAWSAQVCLKAGNWEDIEGGVPVGDGTVAYASFVLTGDMLKYIKQYGMFAAGEGYSSSQISLETVGTEPAGSENSIWVGNATGYVMINNKHFLNANGGYTEWVDGVSTHHNGVKAGDIIRVTFTENENATDQYRWIYVGYNVDGWPSYEMSQVEVGNVVEFLVKENNPEIMMSKETVINHSDHYIITQVELLPAKELTGYYLVGGTTNWAVSENPMSVENGVYSAVIPYLSGYSFALVPNTALTSDNVAVLNWGAAIRPEAQTEVVFENMTSNVSTTDNGQNWKMRTLGENESNEYTATFKYDAVNSTWSIECAATVTISDAGYATYSNAKPYKVNGAEVYTISAADASATFNKLADGAEIPAGTGVILKGSGDVTITPSAGTAEIGTNLLKGSGDYSYVITESDNDAYIFQVGTEGVGFYKVVLADLSADDRVLPAHKAFLKVAQGGGAPFYGFGGEGTTGINNVERGALNVEGCYTLDGRRVENPTKGLYIINGKKVVIK